MPAYSRILLPWDSQPQEVSNLSADLPAAFAALVPQGAVFRNSLGTDLGGTYAGNTAEPGPGGLAVRFAGGAGDGYKSGTRSVTTVERTTYGFLAVFDSLTTGVNRTILGANGALQVRLGTTNQLQLLQEGTAVRGTSSAAYTTGVHTVGVTCETGGSTRVWCNGELVITWGSPIDIGTGDLQFIAAARRNGSGETLNGRVYHYQHWSGIAPTPEQMVAATRFPWETLFAPRAIWVPVSAGGGGVSGTLATTNANDTSAASGTTTIVGTLATTNADDTSAASGSVGGDVTGTVNYTNANDTVSASGTTTVTGTVARTNADDSAAASGWAGAVTGTLAYTNANDTADASGIAETGFLAGIGGWGPIRRRKRRDEDEDKPQELPEVVEVVAAKPRKTLKLADIIGKRQAAQITSVDLSEAVAASKKRKRQQEDELLLLM